MGSLNENLNDIFHAIEVSTTLESVRRLGNWTEKISKPNRALIIAPKSWDALKILAKDKKALFCDQVFYVLSPLANSESEKKVSWEETSFDCKWNTRNSTEN